MRHFGGYCVQIIFGLPKFFHFLPRTMFCPPPRIVLGRKQLKGMRHRVDRPISRCSNHTLMFPQFLIPLPLILQSRTLLVEILVLAHAGLYNRGLPEQKQGEE
jgi:hypothetical protein